MKAIIRDVSLKIPLDLEEINVDGSAELREKFSDEVPILFVDGRKAFKYRMTKAELEKQLGRTVRARSRFRFSRWVH
jgi:hypothetical protein